MSPDTAQLLSALKTRQLTTPFLLFLVGHRPLTFVIGQALFVAAPLFELFDRKECSRWAAVLSDPECVEEIKQTLEGISPLPDRDETARDETSRDSPNTDRTEKERAT